MLYKLSFGYANFVKAAERSLKLSLERLVALKNLSRIILLGFFFLS